LQVAGCRLQVAGCRFKENFYFIPLASRRLPRCFNSSARLVADNWGV
jgi:hypothetical protein